MFRDGLLRSNPNQEEIDEVSLTHRLLALSGLSLSALILMGVGCTKVVELNPIAGDDFDLVRPAGGTKFSVGGNAEVAYSVPRETEGVWNTYLKWPTHNGADISTIRIGANPGAASVELLTSLVDRPDSTWVGYDEPDYTAWSPIVTTGGESLTWVLPDSVGLRLQHHAQFLVRAHYLNYASAPVHGGSARVVTTFAPITNGVLKYLLSRMIIEARAFSIPASSGTYTVEKVATMPQDVTLIAVAPQYHRIGRSLQIDVRDSPSSSWSTMYSTTDAIPHFAPLGTPARVPSGGQVRVTVTYQNASASPVMDGPRWKDDEACRVVAYFYGAPLPAPSLTLLFR